MDPRLRQILELALRPETGDGESAAALAAARRLVVKQGMDKLLAPVQERVVYRDRPAANAPARCHVTKDFTITMPANFSHSMVERVFKDGAHLGLQVQLVSFTTLRAEIVSGSVLKIAVTGSSSAIKQYDGLLLDYIAQMNKSNTRSHNSKASHTNAAPSSSTGLKGWFQRIFG